jgi:hypothetical protein
MVSIIFVATFLNNPNKTLLLLSKYLPMKYLFSMKIPRIFIKYFLLGLNADKNLINLFTQSVNLILPEVLLFRLEEIINLPKRLTIIDTRSIYIESKQDKIVNKENTNEMKKYIKDLIVYQVDGPHLILQQNPNVCSEIIINEIHYGK